MPSIDTTKDDLLRALATERDWWKAVLDLAAEDVPLTGDEEIDGSWSLKQLLAHVEGWRAWTLARLETAARGSGTPQTPWPATMRDDTEDDVDAINAWFSDQSRDVSFASVAERLFGQLDALESVVGRMSDADLLTPGRFGWLGQGFESLPVGPALIGYSITHVHTDHAPALEAWLTERRGQHAELPPAPSNFGYVD
jgi:hypothetical protein